jgi:hypothetical protein
VETIRRLLDWIGDAPSWLTHIGSLLGAIGGVYAWVVSRRDKSIEQRRALENEWFRVLIFDQVLPPLLEFLSQQRSAFAAIAGNQARRHVPAEYDAELQVFKSAKASTQRLLLVVRVISSEKYEEVIGLLDEMDDAVTVHCAANSGFSVAGYNDFKEFRKLEARLSALTVELFTTLKNLHTQMHDVPGFWRRSWHRFRARGG